MKDTATPKIMKKTRKMGNEIEELANSFGKKVEKIGKQKRRRK